MKKNNPVLIVGITLGVLALIALILLVGKSFGPGSNSQQPRVDTIVLKKGDSQFSLDGSGNAIWTTGDKTTSALWPSDKTNSLFEYFYANWAKMATIQNGVATVNVGNNDELANAVINEGSGGGGGSGGGDGGGDISQYFGSPSPTPTPTPNSGTGGEGGDPGPGADSGGPSWCQHWKLSYCADPIGESPTPTPQPMGPTPLPPDCNDPGNQETGRTVIGNDLCLPSPTPTATP